VIMFDSVKITVTCPYCSKTHVYIPFEYEGEYLVCKSCGSIINLNNIFTKLNPRSQEILKQNPITKHFLHESYIKK